MNYRCPFSRADVGTRWCIALGLAGDAKLNFNVSEQLNDWGLMQTHFSLWAEDIEALTDWAELCSQRGSCTSALTPWANPSTQPSVWTLHLFSRSYFTFSTHLNIRPAFPQVCLLFDLAFKNSFSLADANAFFLKHRKYCQRVPSYLLFSPFESFYPNDWVHNSFHLCEISSGYECICVVWMLFLLHVARVKVDATCIQTALSLLILGLNSLYLSRWWGLALSSCWIKHFYPTVWEILIFVFEEKKNPAYFISLVRSPS